MGVRRDFAAGIASMIAAAGVATYNPEGIYTADETGILHMVLPQAPDRVVVVAVVPMLDDVSQPSGTVMVQMRSRGRPNQPLDVTDLSDSLLPIFQNLTQTVIGGVPVTQMYRTTSTSLGQDDAKRWVWVDQYYADIDYPASDHRPAGGFW